MRYSAGAQRAGATASDQSLGHIWNPHGAKSIFVVEAWLWTTDTNADWGASLSRVTTSGTGDMTPGIDNHYDRQFAPVSGALIQNLTGGASFAGPDLATTGSRQNAGTIQGVGVHAVFNEPIEVPAGTGLGWRSLLLTGAHMFGFVWDE